MLIKLKSTSVTLKTKDKYCTEDIHITLDESLVNGEISTLKNVLDATKNCCYLFKNYKGESVDGFISYSDTENVENFEFMFQYCSNLTAIPPLNVSNGTNFNYMFGGCNSLTAIPPLNVSNGTNFANMFSGCNSLTAIPPLNVSNGTKFEYMFQNCSNLQAIPPLNVSNGTMFNYMLGGCNSLTAILMYGMKVKFDISYCSKLNAEALVTILSNCQVITSTQTLKMGSTLLAKLEGVYVKETSIEQYEGITCRPCVICESTDTGAMLVTDYFTGKGWTLA